MSETEPVIAPYAFSASLTLCLDVRNPLSYLALQPAFDLADELGASLAVLPFAVAPLKEPAPAQPEDDRGTRHRQLRAHYLAGDIGRYAAARGLTIRGIYRSPDATRFAAGLLWLNDHHPELVRAYLNAAFDGYWNQSLDVAAPGAIDDLIRSLGANADDFADAATGAEVVLSDLRDALVAGGVFNVPSFVVADQVFVGRAHLPMVRWLLTGRQGPAPI